MILNLFSYHQDWWKNAFQWIWEKNREKLKDKLIIQEVHFSHWSRWPIDHSNKGISGGSLQIIIRFLQLQNISIYAYLHRIHTLVSMIFDILLLYIYRIPKLPHLRFVLISLQVYNFSKETLSFHIYCTRTLPKRTISTKSNKIIHGFIKLFYGNYYHKIFKKFFS